MPELRKDPVVGRWVIISTERSKRPRDVFVLSQTGKPSEGECEFCTHKEDYPEIFSLRDSSNPERWHVLVTPRKNRLLQIEGEIDRRAHGIYDVMNGIGAHELVLETPEHVLNIADLPLETIDKVLSVYALRIRDLEQDERLRYALIYKNYEGERQRGNIFHSRSNIIALPVNPKRVKEKLAGARRYYNYHERCIFCDIIRQEKEQKVRIVDENEAFIAISAFASRFPFETWILPKRHLCDFYKLDPSEFRPLSEILKRVLLKIKIGLNDPPYSWVFFTAPFRKKRRPGYWITLEEDFHWHIEIIPQLTRIAGFEWGTGFYINPMLPEDSAEFLRSIEVEV